MYNIENPVHYICANNPEGVDSVLVQYGVPQPRNVFERVQEAQKIVEQYDERALNDLLRQHPDKEFILKAVGHFGNFCSGHAHSNYINAGPINAQRLNTAEIEQRVNEATKTAEAKAETPLEKKMKTNTVLLYGSAAILLLILGSKLLK